MNRNILILIGVLFMLTFSFGGVNYVGYSGAPGSLGSCAGSCHGSGTGTIVVQGFPASYVPGQTYLITVKKTSGLKIGNFNASVRYAQTNRRAGTITAVYQTATYNVESESNGVHLSSASKDSAKFNWTASTISDGDIKFYLAGTQGTTESAPNTNIVLTATPASGIHETESFPATNLGLHINQSIINKSLVLSITIPARATAYLKILQTDGRIVNTIPVPNINNQNVKINWTPVDRYGKHLPNGNYIVILICGKAQISKKIIIVNK
jgi:hypothetical protein